MKRITPQAMAKWFIALCCLTGKEDEDYWLLETDPYWWAIYLWIRRN